MIHPRLRFVALSAALLLSPSAAQAQQAKPKAPDNAPKGEEPAQRASGVIVKVEDRTKSFDKKPGLILTINTAAEWAEFARDQAPETRRKVTKSDAAKGDQSTAAKGEPEDENTVVKVEVDSHSKLEVRFRASDDETSAGSATPAGAVDSEKEKPRASDEGKDAKKAQAPAKIKPTDLRKGLFVEVDYREVKGVNRANRLVVIKPIGGPNTSDSEPGAEEKPAK